MLTRRAKAYSSSCSQTISLYVAIWIAKRVSCVAPPSERCRVVSESEIAKKSIKTAYSGVQGHLRSLKSVAIESQCTTSY